MRFFSARHSVRRAAPSTRLGVERLDDRVLPSGVAMAAPALLVAPPAANASELQISRFDESHAVKGDMLGGGVGSRDAHVSAFGGASGGVVLRDGSVISLSITRSSGEEIPQ